MGRSQDVENASVQNTPGQGGDFRPHWLLRNRHIQTVLGTLLTESPPEGVTEVHRIGVADGESLALHENAPLPGINSGLVSGNTDLEPQSPRIALLIHGLGGCHRSGYLVRVTKRLIAAGVRVFRVDMRGSGAGMDWAYRPPHAGLSDDICAVLRWINQRWPTAQLAVAGFSLGGNILLKLLGESAVSQGIVPWRSQLRRAIAVAPPIDLPLAARQMEVGVGKMYTRYFLRMLGKQVRMRQAKWPAWEAIPWDPAPRTIRQFDDRFTAPLAGFSCAEDYYEKTSARSLLTQIDVPTDILFAQDDPIVPAASFKGVEISPTTRIQVTKCGGHVGFLSLNRHGKLDRWMDQWVTERLLQGVGIGPAEEAMFNQLAKQFAGNQAA